MHTWLSRDHPLPFYVAAIIFASIALVLAVGTSIFAQETNTTDSSGGSGTSSSGTITPTSCTYSYSSWSACQPEGKRYRTVTGVSPSGCVQTSEPDLQESCSYQAPQCNYSYSDWGICQSNGKQGRSLLSKSPAGCEEYTKPVLERTCTYTSTTTTSTTSTSTSGTSSSGTTACSYSYSSWSSCQSDGKRYRSVIGMSPSGCVQTTAPQLQESCSFQTTSTSSSTSGSTNTSTTSTSTSGTSSTTTTTPLLDQCLYTYSDWSVCQSTQLRTRVLLQRTPEPCAEYTKPVVSQSCVYDPASTSTVLSTSSAASSSSTPTSASSGTTDGLVTPPFAFSGISDGATWTGTVRIRGEVSGAQSVEYYLVPVGSNTYKYIGMGQVSSSEIWILSFRTTEFPNGEYYLRAKIRNQYGEYGGGQRRIRVLNQSVTPPSGSQESQSSVQSTTDESEETQQVFIKKFTQDITAKDDQFQTVGTTVKEQKKQIFSYCETNPSNCFPERDTDRDGLNDIDEVRFGTDPEGADSDWDGFIDGDEVKNGFDPVKYSPGDQSDRMVFESPKTSGETKTHYRVHDVVMKSNDEDGKPTLQLVGAGLPNSFVTIYIYSEPIVLTVKTDSQGNWTYTLDKELGDGQHEVYVAVTDNTGKITGKSEPLSFVKTAQAVTVIPAAEAASITPTSVTESRTERDMLFLAAILIGAVAVALALLGIAKHRHAQQKELLNLS